MKMPFIRSIHCKRELKIDVTLSIIVYIDSLVCKNIWFGKCRLEPFIFPFSISVMKENLRLLIYLSNTRIFLFQIFKHLGQKYFIRLLNSTF